jgi:hypothetical protein
MSYSRRDFLVQSLAAASVTWSLVPGAPAAAESAKNIRLATFRFDVTPPEGHSLCGGWIKPVIGVDDPLEAIGFVLLGAGKPIVLCAVDWTGLLNSAHIAWREALAEAAGTTPERVAVQCVHQHNAPFACLDSEAIVAAQGDLPHIVERDYFQDCLNRGRAAVTAGLKNARPVTHVAHGQGKVKEVASNRRVSRNPDGTVKAMRGSSCKDPVLRAMTEGTIDPWLKTVAFYDGDEKIVSCHYYATHPMSYYGDGMVSSDFTGIARKRRQAEEPGCTHIYFTGCAGNISAGKYNDGSQPVRAILADKMYDGIVAAEATLVPKPIKQVAWRTADLVPSPNKKYDAAAIEKEINNHENSVVKRNRPSYTLSWLRRLEKGTPIVLSALLIDDISFLHLPAECFIEYQLRAQDLAPNRFVATAAYGDGGPWYIPTKEEYPTGGYECSVAFSDPSIDDLLTEGMKALLA